MSTPIGPVATQGGLQPDPVDARDVAGSQRPAGDTPTARPETRGEKRVEEAGQKPASDVQAATAQRQSALLDKLSENGLKPYAKLAIERDERSGQSVFKHIDSRSGEVIAQWPREEMLRAADEAGVSTGVFLDDRA